MPPAPGPTMTIGNMRSLGVRSLAVTCDMSASDWEAAVRELRKLIKENYGDVTININPESIYTGALGASEFARRTYEGGAAMETAA